MTLQFRRRDGVQRRRRASAGGDGQSHRAHRPATRELGGDAAGVRRSVGLTGASLKMIGSKSWRICLTHEERQRFVATGPVGTRIRRANVSGKAIAIGGLLLSAALCGCVSVGAPEKEGQLSAAGFMRLQADTPQKMAKLQALPQDTLSMRRERAATLTSSLTRPDAIAPLSATRPPIGSTSNCARPTTSRRCRRRRRSSTRKPRRTGAAPGGRSCRAGTDRAIRRSPA